jgi:primosomal protein N' (replication factor Y)
MYAEVAVGGKMRLLLHYQVPDELAGKLTPGHLVNVPLRNEERPGVVVALSPSSPVSGTRPISALVDPIPAISPEFLALARWLADFYLAPLAESIWLMVPPPRVGPRRVFSAELAATPSEIEAARPSLGRPVKQADILDWLASCDDPLPTVAQVRTAVDCSLAPFQALARHGWIELDQEEDLQTALLLLTPDQARDRADDLRGSAVYYAVLEFLARQVGPAPIDAIRAETKCQLRHLKRLESLNLVMLSEEQIVRDPLADVEFVSTQPPSLMPDQAAAWHEIEHAMSNEARQWMPNAFLLHGVTGSGKTEIYLRAVAAALDRGKQAIVLVPEISLTPQTTRRFLARFPGRVGLFHSQLSSGERYETWQRARAGQIDVVIGPRSALFTPLPNLGLIVLDEEHDASYKSQDRAVAYHSRDVAVELARRTGALLLLGSATPSLESYRRAQTGEFRLLALPQRIRGHVRRLDEQQRRYHVSEMRYQNEQDEVRFIPLPPVQVVDLRQELRSGNVHIFSRALQEELRGVLQRDEQAILFLNRRGNATFVLCRDCGHVLKCPRCDAPLTQHEFRSSNLGSERAQLVCHHCNYHRQPPGRCPVCEGKRIRYFGLGTQRVEKALQDLLPGARTLRWDRDTVSRKGAHELILERFANRQADVLIGTQMIAKGLDLPLVTLVGVISADTALNLPDFRSAERTFQLLTQVAGRAGRGLLGGRVIVQTYNPDHYAIRAAARHDYERFAEQELAFRREQAYPPFQRLVRLEYRHRRQEKARLAAESLARTLRAVWAAKGRSSKDIIGPAPAFFAKRRDRFRWQIILRADDPADFLRQVDIPPGWRVDVDPVSVL